MYFESRNKILFLLACETENLKDVSYKDVFECNDVYMPVYGWMKEKASWACVQISYLNMTARKEEDVR